MKKIILGIVVVVLAVLAVACTCQNSPKGVVKTYVTALQKSDKEAAADCFYYSGTEEEIAKQRSSMVSLIEKGIKKMEEKGGIKSFDVTNVEENGDKAIVHGIITYGNGETIEDETIPTEKVDGKWYIDIEK